MRGVLITSCGTIFYFLMVLVPSVAQAQRLHAVVLSDTSPWAGWGHYLPNIQVDSATMFSIFATNIPEQQLELHPYPIEDDAAGDPQQVLGFLEQVPVGPNDTFVFYFTGHGGNDDRGQYFAFAKGRLYREEVRSLMQEKGARLNVILTDSCNQRGDGEAFVAPSVDMQPPPAVTPLFYSLFFEPRGIVDISASSPGEAAFFGPLTEPSGSLFTTQVANFVYRYKAQRTTWEHFLRSVSLNVHIAFRNAYPNGAIGGKGRQFQSDQNVYAYEYPEMPPKQGPRTGFTARDHQNQGAVITQVRPGFPASQVYDLTARRYLSLREGEVIVAANNMPIRTAAEIAEAVKNSPQVMRLKILSPGHGEREVLMRLRY